MTVHTEVRGSTLLVTLDVPKANAINVATSMELYDAFVRLRDDDALRTAVLTGAGERFFSAGWDLKAAAAGRGGRRRALPRRVRRAHRVLRRRQAGHRRRERHWPSAAASSWRCRPTSSWPPSTREFALPEVKLGIVADSGGLLRIPARVPRAVALEWLLTGRRITRR